MAGSGRYETGAFTIQTGYDGGPSSTASAAMRAIVASESASVGMADHGVLGRQLRARAPEMTKNCEPPVPGASSCVLAMARSPSA